MIVLGAWYEAVMNDGIPFDSMVIACTSSLATCWHTSHHAVAGISSVNVSQLENYE